MTIKYLIDKKIVTPRQYVKVIQYDNENFNKPKILFEKEFVYMYERLYDLQIKGISSDIKRLNNDFYFPYLILYC